MREVTYYIDDLVYFKKEYALSEEIFNDVFSGQTSFKVIYTLIGDGTNVDRYTLTDYKGRRIPFDSLNGYQKGVVLCDCYSHFVGGKYHSDSKTPCGVVKIEERKA